MTKELLFVLIFLITFSIGIMLLFLDNHLHKKKNNQGSGYSFVEDPLVSELPTTATKRFVDPNTLLRTENGLIISKNKKKITSVQCPNCGAPLDVIYKECKYCGSKYKNVDKILKSYNGDRK